MFTTVERRLTQDELSICEDMRQSITAFVSTEIGKIFDSSTPTLSHCTKADPVQYFQEPLTLSAVEDYVHQAGICKCCKSQLDYPKEIKSLSVLPISRALFEQYNNLENDAIESVNFPGDINQILSLCSSGKNRFWLESVFVEYTWITLEARLRVILADYNERVALAVADRIMKLEGNRISQEIGTTMRTNLHSPNITNRFVNCRHGNITISDVDFGVNMDAFCLMNTIESGDVDQYKYELFSRHEFQQLIGSKLIELMVREIAFVAFQITVDLTERSCCIRFNWH